MIVLSGGFIPVWSNIRISISVEEAFKWGAAEFPPGPSIRQPFLSRSWMRRGEGNVTRLSDEAKLGEINNTLED